jgi:hypothetical protein
MSEQKHDLDRDMDQLEACWETDALVAVYVLRQIEPPIHHYEGGMLFCGGGKDFIMLAPFSRNIEMAWIAFSGLPADRISLERENGTWTCKIPGAFACAKTPELAICRALLRAAKEKALCHRREQ